MMAKNEIKINISIKRWAIPFVYICVFARINPPNYFFKIEKVIG